MPFPTHSNSLQNIAAQHDYVVLDNIFLFPVRHITPREEKINIPYISHCVQELNSLAYWMQQQGEKVRIPFDISRQGWKGYGLLTRAVHGRKDPPQVRKRLDLLLEASYTALSKSREHIFSLPAAEDVQYRHLAGKVKELAKEYCLKKENHAQDHGADEDLASSGIYLAHRGSTAIVTLDRDIESIVRGYDKLVSPRFTPTVYRLRPYDA